jgi:predicted GNAT family acetyltransferase
MNEQASLADIAFTENGPVDVAQLNALYRLIGWDHANRRTEAETTEMLRVNHYYIAAHTTEGTLVGFARVCGDPYIAQVLDVITHPAYRRRGIATTCMLGVLAHLQRSRYVSVTLTDGSGIEGFYQRFGFRVFKDGAFAQIWELGLRMRGSVTTRTGIGRCKLSHYEARTHSIERASPSLRTTKLP